MIFIFQIICNITSEGFVGINANIQIKKPSSDTREMTAVTLSNGVKLLYI